jgi:hypothetical protein
MLTIDLVSRYKGEPSDLFGDIVFGRFEMLEVTKTRRVKTRSPDNRPFHREIES